MTTHQLSCGLKGRRISPGRSRTFLETRAYAQGIKVRLPVLTVQGARRGPLAVIMAGQHGRELNGIAAIEQVFGILKPSAMSGRVVFLPVMNPPAVRMRRQDYPVEESRYRPTGIGANFNINQTWSSDMRGDGSCAAEISAAAWDTYLRHADVSADLHGWSTNSLSLAWAHRRHRALLRAVGFPWHMTLDRAPRRGDGVSESAAYAAGIPHVVIELSPQNVVDRDTVALGVRSILNLLKAVGVLAGKADLPALQYEFAQNHEEIVMRTPVEGLLVSERVKGDWLRKGETAARVLSLDTLRTVWEYKTPHDALVFNMGYTSWGEDYREGSMVYPGQAVGLLKRPTRILRNPAGTAPFKARGDHA